MFVMIGMIGIIGVVFITYSLSQPFQELADPQRDAPQDVSERVNSYLVALQARDPDRMLQHSLSRTREAKWWV